MSHTPGPWRVGLDVQAWNSPSSVRGTVEYQAEHGAVYRLAEVSYPTSRDGTVGHEERIGNALLIAAAPDLYSALNKAIAFIEDEYPRESLAAGNWPTVKVFLDLLDAAIAKAEGK